VTILAKLPPIRKKPLAPRLDTHAKQWSITQCAYSLPACLAGFRHGSYGSALSWHVATDSGKMAATQAVTQATAGNNRLLHPKPLIFKGLAPTTTTTTKIYYYY